ncbi:MAG: NAD-dependent epimerase/dehydratase family protein [Actinomycetota bacterium]
MAWVSGADGSQPGAQSEETPQRSVVVTGAAGFIGSHLVEHLVAQGHTVTGIDDFDTWYDPAAKRANLAAALDAERFSLIEGDLSGVGDRGLGADRLIDLFTDADIVFHLAGRPGVQDSWGAGFADYVERNVLLTQRIYEAALAAGAGRVVYASSSSVYGSSAGADGARQTAPVSPYGVSKLAGEHLAGVYRERGLSVTSLRYFTVYGPRQRPDMAMHRLFRATMDDGPTFVLRGDGTQRREFTHVSDVVAATALAGTRAEAAEAVIDIGGGSSVSLAEVIDLVEQTAGAPVRRRSLPTPAGDPPATVAEHDKARHLLAWTPTTDLADGLASQWAWHRQVATAASSASSDTVVVGD